MNNQNKIFGFVKRLFKEKPLATVSAIVLVVLFFVGVFCDILAPYGVNDIHLESILKPPSDAFILGTDGLGRDLFSRIIYATRISVFVGLGAAAVCSVVATLIGVVSGYLGGKFDLIVQRFVDAWMCFPGMFIILTIMAIIGPGIVQVIMVIGVLYGMRDSRVVRSATIAVRNNTYVEAAKACGSSYTRVIIRHILPNVSTAIIIIFTLCLGQAILMEATMSFLGFGVPPPAPSFGSMLSIEGRRNLLFAPWLAIWPGIVLAIVVYANNMLGDGIRDLLDPRLKGGSRRYGMVKKALPGKSSKSVG